MIVLTISSFLATAVCAWLAVYALARGSGSPLTGPFFLLCVAFGVSSFLMALVGISPTAEQAEFWFRLATPFSSVVPSVTLHVLLAIAGRPSTGRGWKIPLIYLPTLPMIFQETLGPASARVAIVPSPYGWLLGFGGDGAPYVACFVAWTFLSVLGGYLFVFLWGRGASTHREKRQARGILLTGLAASVSLLVGHVASGYYLDGGMPPALPVPGLIVSLGFAAAIFRHRLMVVTPSLALDQVLARLRDMLFILDRQGRVLEANAIARETLARPGQSLVGRSLIELAVDPGAMTRALAAMQDASPPGPRVETALVMEPGPMPVEVSGSAIRDADGDAVALAVVVRDLRDTERLRREIDERRRVEERLSATLRAVADGIVASDVAGRVVLMNPVAERLTGWSERDAVGCTLQEVLALWDVQTQARVEDPLVLASAPSEPGGPAADVLVGPEDGPRRLATCIASSMRNPDGSNAGFVLVLRDVTVARQVEDELQKASKLESVGLLAGGIAHDFNNILTAMLGYVEMARMDLPDDSDVVRKLVEAESAGRRARDLTQKLLTFARGGAPVLKSTDVGRVISESVSLLSGSKTARCEVRIDPATWPALADEGQLYQALSNLLLNAFQAMPAGGRVTVSADNVDARAAFGEAGVTIPAGRWVRMTVEDQGVGIAREHLPRVFDPFFTTRPNGTGLGLSTTYSIVRKHAGRLTMESEPGRGTTVRLYFPTSEEPAARPPGKPPAQMARAIAGCRVLVMDDQPAVLGVAREMLAAFSCHAHVCADGAQAVRSYREALAGGSRFAAVILDCVVPGGMGGAEAARQILALDPGARIVISSGYVDQPVLVDYGAHGFVGVLHKPYRLDTLGKVIEDAIAGGTGTPHAVVSVQ